MASVRAAALALVGLSTVAAGAAAQAPTAERAAEDRTSGDAWRFLGGSLLAFGAHELGHVGLNLVFGADPGVKPITVAGLPFFAVTHARPLSRRREYAVAASGLWVQHALDEGILSSRSDIRRAHAPLRKGMLAFDALASALYVGAALARRGPPERDTRTMAATLDLDERWVAVLVAAPLALDLVRYVHPEARWAAWSSRGAKVGLVLLVLR